MDTLGGGREFGFQVVTFLIIGSNKLSLENKSG